MARSLVLDARWRGSCAVSPERIRFREKTNDFTPDRVSFAPTQVVRETFALPCVDDIVLLDLETLSVPVASDTDPLVVSSLAKDFAARLGFSHVAVAQVALAAGELASNCWRHGGGGRIELHALEHGLEVRAIDHGPGIPDLSHAEQDGVSRGRRHTPHQPIRDSLGTGLGSVRRLMDEVEVRTFPAAGTTVIARKLRTEPG